MSPPDYDPRSWTKTGTWQDETRDDALGRSPQFAHRFFAQMFAAYPELEPKISFLRWSVQPGDAYAVVPLEEGGFCIQIDADLGYVIVSGPSGTAEYGDWHGDLVPVAMKYVAEIVATKGASPPLA